MLIELALNIRTEIIRINDLVKVDLKSEKEPIIATLIDIFTSIWSPYEIRLRLSDGPYHKSIGVDDIISIVLIDKSV